MAQELVIKQYVKPAATFKLFPYKQLYMLIFDQQTHYLRYRVINLDQGVVAVTCYSEDEVITFLNKWKAIPQNIEIKEKD